VTSISSANVHVILDQGFGERLENLPVHEAVWIVRSPANSRAAERLRVKRPGESHLNGITTFAAKPDTTPEGTLIGNLEVIDLHHGEYSSKPPYSAICVHGASLTETVKRALSEFGFDQFQLTPDGFLAEKSAASKT
jgi:hypothetical protein